MTGTKGRYRDDFSAPLETAAASPTAIGARFIEVIHQGRRHRVSIDPSLFRCGRFVAELAGAAASRHAALDLSWGVLQRAERCIRSFAAWIDGETVDPIAVRAASLTVDRSPSCSTAVTSRTPSAHSCAELVEVDRTLTFIKQGDPGGN